jgi:hypothetical protein
MTLYHDWCDEPDRLVSQQGLQALWFLLPSLHKWISECRPYFRLSRNYSKHRKRPTVWFCQFRDLQCNCNISNKFFIKLLHIMIELWQNEVLRARRSIWPPWLAGYISSERRKWNINIWKIQPRPHFYVEMSNECGMQSKPARLRRAPEQTDV